MDKLTPQQRHNTMASIRGKNTKPELIVRRGLWKRGFRYRLNHKRLPGHPDLVLRKYRTCIFVNGCFWHGHLVETNTMESSACCKIPTTNHDFWVKKIRRNKERDKEEQKQLAAMGWHCITVWSANWNHRNEKRRWTQSPSRWTTSGYKTIRLKLYPIQNWMKRKSRCRWQQKNKCYLTWTRSLL